MATWRDNCWSFLDTFHCKSHRSEDWSTFQYWTLWHHFLSLSLFQCVRWYILSTSLCISRSPFRTFLRSSLALQPKCMMLLSHTVQMRASGKWSLSEFANQNSPISFSLRLRALLEQCPFPWKGSSACRALLNGNQNYAGRTVAYLAQNNWPLAFLWYYKSDTEVFQTHLAKCSSLPVQCTSQTEERHIFWTFSSDLVFFALFVR